MRESSVSPGAIGEWVVTDGGADPLIPTLSPKSWPVSFGVKKTYSSGHGLRARGLGGIGGSDGAVAAPDAFSGRRGGLNRVRCGDSVSLRGAGMGGISGGLLWYFRRKRWL